jgi:glycolate oxidase
MSNEEREDTEFVEKTTEKVVIERVILKPDEFRAALEKIKSIVGAENVSDDPLDLICHERDLYTPVSKRFLGAVATPAMVVRPKSTEEVQGVVRIANEYKIPITPFSFGTNMGGAAVPSVEGAILLDLRRMNRIIEINEETMTATIEPGVSYGRLDYEAKKKGLRTVSTIGGYTGGLIGNFVTANVRPFNAMFGFSDPIVTMEVVLPTGEILRTGSMAYPGYEDVNPYVRLAWGPDFAGLFRGSAGAFGIITKAVVKLYPAGEVEKRLKFAFSDLDSLLEAMKKTQRNEIGRAVLGIDRNEMFFVCTERDERESMSKEEWQKTYKSFPEWAMLINLEGRKEIVEADEALLKKICEEYGGKELELPPKYAESLDDFSTHRGRMIMHSLVIPSMICLWTCVPTSNIKAFYDKTLEVLKKLDMRFPLFKDIFNPGRWFLIPFDRGNTYMIGVDVDFDTLDEEQLQKATEFLLSYVPLMTEVKGTIPMTMGPLVDMLMPSYSKLMKSIKRMLDPNGIFSPNRLCLVG